jgi:membrane associated rhomboid family serine protease
VIPLRDDVPNRSFPMMTVLLIGANVAAFLYQLSLEAGVGDSTHAAAAFVMEFGAVPCRITGQCIAEDFPAPLATVFTSMFLHGGLFHIGGNMLYLWIFGDNVEDTLGHLRYLAFYLLSGVAAAVGQVVMSPASTVPMVGASGAISGVLGAYLFLFPYANVRTLVIFGFFFRIVDIPALLMLGFWIVVQVFSGLMAQNAVSRGGGESGGVAWFAHIGGFVAGVLLLFLFRPRGTRRYTY